VTEQEDFAMIVLGQGRGTLVEYARKTLGRKQSFSTAIG
jgi:hypothetical protein